MKKLLLLAILGVLCAIAVVGKAQENLIMLHEADTSFALWGHKQVYYCQDSIEELSSNYFQSIAQQKVFISTATVPSTLGFFDEHIWLKFRVRKQTDKPISWMIHNDYPMVEKLYLYLVNETTGEVEFKTIKETFPAYQRDINVHQAAFPLELVSHTNYTVYLYMISEDIKKMNFKITETHKFYETYFDELWIWTAHLGFVLCMLFVQIIFFLVTKDRNFFFYFLFLLSYFLVAIVGGYGIIDKLLWENNAWIKKFGIAIVTLFSDISGIFFYTYALRLKALARFWNKLLIWQGVLAGITILWIFVDPHLMSVNLYSSCIVINFFVLASFACLASYKAGNSAAIYYFFGTLAYFVGILVLIFWTLSIITPNILVVNAMHIGSMVEMLFFMWALAQDYRNTRTTKEQVQKELIQTLQVQNQEISNALLKGQTLERKRVAADLHDSLGGTLSAIKWTLASLNFSKLNEQEKQIYDTLIDMTNDAQQRVRFLSHNLLPEDLEKDGLGVSIEKLISKLNQNKKIYFNFEYELQVRLPKNTEFELYNICLEAINNIIKHANATQASISITENNEFVLIQISDNGIGLKNANQGMGLQNIKDRIRSLNGTFQIEALQQGILIIVQIPIK